MIAIEIELLTGRYHGTPWGRHVNEGDVEWPPSPWRLLRALLATGFGKLGWREVPSSARALIARLAETPPAIALPSGFTAHTRHYMPDFKGKTSKILDAFVDVGRGARLGVEWDVELNAPEIEMMDALLARLSYLGRAEAWVEARRVERVAAGLSRCPAAPSAPGPGYERVPLLGPVPEASYAAWREETVAAELATELERKRAAAEAKGKKGPAKLSANDVKKIGALYPTTLVDALLVDTGTLQKAGWSQPPGSQWLSYWRDERVLAPPPSVSTHTRIRRAAPDTALLALASDTKQGERLPPFTDAVLRLELLHDALVRRSSDVSGSPPPCLIGKKNGVRLDGHRHAALVPLCLDGGEPPRVDHVLVHAPMGLDGSTQEALRRVRTVHGRGMRFFVSLVGLGARNDLASRVPMLRESAVWTSATPFVPPRHLKPRGKNTLLGQLLAELESRGLPVPVRVEVELDGDSWIDLDAVEDGVRPASRWRRFRRARLDPARQPPSTRGFGVRLTFPAAIAGPVSLGYGSHFGLGVFSPAG